MFASAAPAQTFPTDAGSGGGENAARHARNLQALDRMIEVGMAMVEAIGQEVIDGPPTALVARGGGTVGGAAPADPARFHSELALAFSRATRAVRLGIALQNKLIEAAQVEARTAPARAQLDALAHGPGRRARLARIVERRARAADRDDAAVRRLLKDAAEQLSDREAFGHLLNRPFEDVVEQICRDLGLSPGGSVLHHEPWAKEERRSGPVGRPLQAYVPPVGPRPPDPGPYAPRPAPAGGSP